jgi:hypothetical protein
MLGSPHGKTALQSPSAVNRWVSIVFIVYATLTRVGFVYSIYFKPAPFLMHIGMRKYTAVEHFVAFAVCGALFSIAYPKRVVTICCVVFGSVIALELAQTIGTAPSLMQSKRCRESMQDPIR